MDFTSYLELPAEAVTGYKESLERLEKSLDPYEQLIILGGIFESFENSRSPQGRGPEWAANLISLYRNLGVVLNDITTNLSEGERQRLSDLEEEVMRLRKRLTSFEDI